MPLPYRPPHYGITDLKFVNGQWFDQFTNDTIWGTTGNDYVTLHGGNDRFYDIAGGNDYVSDVSALNGGWSGSDIISTGIGNDTVVSSLDSANNSSNYGGQGYYGGLGIDTLSFLPNQTGVYVDLSTNIAENVITGEVTQVVGFENVTGSAYGDYLYGDTLDNAIFGYLGNDAIEGRGGSDKLDGGEGNDSVIGGDGNDTVNGGEGNDLVSGDAGFDIVHGGNGNDKVYGGADGDYLFGDDGDDFMNGQSGDDLMSGGNGNDQMYGSAGNDYMTGGLGNDMLDGSSGRDFLIGGGGADSFVFRSVGDSLNTNPDVINDFQYGIDKMDVSFIDARSNVSGNQAFSYIGDHGFSHSGQISSHYDAAHNTTIVKFNTDTDSSAEMTINLTGHITLASTDFLL